MVKPLPPSPLAALVAKVDEERAADGDHSEDRHKALVRAAGRAALEESLNPTTETAELTLESLTAEWLAYAEVFGTNGMAAGSARLAVQDDSTGAPAQPTATPTLRRGRVLGGALLAVVVATAVAFVVARGRYSRAR
jgi:hypothetical protein